jgi:gamma-glutamyltranspeptidase/glutathione hydrolase
VDIRATEAAIATLRHGGNAVDAGVAAAAVLGVTEPFSCGIGGGGFMVIYQADTGTVTTIDHRETAPTAMHPRSFFANGAPLPFNDARYSGLSAGVPGTVRGWELALSRYGTMSLAEVLGPAIGVARDGFVIDQTFYDQAQGNAGYFDDIPSSERLYLDPDGTAKDVGTVLRNPDLATTYQRIAMLGSKGFYRGEIAEAMVEAVQHPPVAPDADHVWRPGVMTMPDLHRYAAVERAPTRVGYRGLDVYGMGPPSSGGATVGEALNILEIIGQERALAERGRAEALHYYLESSRYAFADRNAYLGDPEYFDVPLRGLLSDSFAAERRALVKDTAATSPVPPGDPYPHQGGSGAGEPAVTTTRAGTTTHLTVSDRDGNVVSYTFTIESTGGNGIVVPGYGFLLNNELTDFNYDSTTHPNRVEGGKRPRSSMSPTIVTRDGVPVLAVGSPGGSTIITTALQILMDRLDLGTSLPAAIAAPRLTQRNTATTLVEPAFLNTPEAAELAARGHRLVATSEIGAATGIEFLGDGRVLAAAEPQRRGGGSAAVENPD